MLTGLYQHREKLETIFAYFDRDKDGVSEHREHRERAREGGSGDTPGGFADLLNYDCINVFIYVRVCGCHPSRP